MAGSDDIHNMPTTNDSDTIDQSPPKLPIQHRKGFSNGAKSFMVITILLLSYFVISGYSPCSYQKAQFKACDSATNHDNFGSSYNLWISSSKTVSPSGTLQVKVGYTSFLSFPFKVPSYKKADDNSYEVPGSNTISVSYVAIISRTGEVSYGDYAIVKGISHSKAFSIPVSQYGVKDGDSITLQAVIEWHYYYDDLGKLGSNYDINDVKPSVTVQVSSTPGRGLSPHFSPEKTGFVTQAIHWDKSYSVDSIGTVGLHLSPVVDLSYSPYYWVKEGKDMSLDQHMTMDNSSYITVDISQIPVISAVSSQIQTIYTVPVDILGYHKIQFPNFPMQYPGINLDLYIEVTGAVIMTNSAETGQVTFNGSPIRNVTATASKDYHSDFKVSKSVDNEAIITTAYSLAITKLSITGSLSTIAGDQAFAQDVPQGIVDQINYQSPDTTSLHVALHRNYPISYILLYIFVIASIIAVFILLWKRRDKKSAEPEYPSLLTPNIKPSSQTNPNNQARAIEHKAFFKPLFKTIFVVWVLILIASPLIVLYGLK